MRKTKRGCSICALIDLPCKVVYNSLLVLKVTQRFESLQRLLVEKDFYKRATNGKSSERLFDVVVTVDLQSSPSVTRTNMSPSALTGSINGAALPACESRHGSC